MQSQAPLRGYTVLYWKLNEKNGKEMDDLLLLVIQDVLNGSSYQFRKRGGKKGDES